MTSVTPACAECAAITERIEVEGEQLFRCPACGLRTYGTGDEDDDQDLPSYSEVDENGAVIIYHGNCEPDFEATAEYPQDDDGDEDDPDGDDQEEPDDPGPAPVGGWEPQVRDVRVKDLAYALTGGWVWIYGDGEGWRFFTSAIYDPDAGDTTVTITYSDSEVVREDPWPQARMVHAGPEAIPTASRPGPARLVIR
ncbi:hypothetical protein ABZY68_25345 [Streptomyces sp. NPDC006482]|uniref:hypothetical protein n=1 Tax=Streptomyces sp. NPDC006482 TaxID=3154306 RepID=UPI0033B90801